MPTASLPSIEKELAHIFKIVIKMAQKREPLEPEDFIDEDDEIDLYGDDDQEEDHKVRQFWSY